MNLLSIFLGALFILVCILAAGYAFWRVCAALFRSASTAEPALHRCNACGRLTPVDEPCLGCGAIAALRSDLSDASFEIDITVRQIRRLVDENRIDSETFERVLIALGRQPATRAPVAAQASTFASAMPNPSMQAFVPPPLPRVSPPVPLSYSSTALGDRFEPQEPAEGELEFLDEQPVITLQPPPPQAVTPVAPKRPMGEVLAAFMEESNIRWGELVGGCLVLGCSIALVMMFWAQIVERPWLKFFLFTGVTSGVFGVGLYTHHRWKLPTTSRGILLLGALLVPLNLLAITAFANPAALALPRLAGGITALVLFSLLLWPAARVLAPRWPLLLAAGLIAVAASQLPVVHFGHGASNPMLLALAGLPLLTYVLASGAAAFSATGSLRRVGNADDVDDADAAGGGIQRGPLQGLLLLLGILTFASTIPVLLLAHQNGWVLTFQRIAPLLSLAAFPALATGTVFWRFALGHPLVRWRVAGTAVGIAGVLCMTGALALAWPDPKTVLPVAVINSLALAFIGVRFSLPAAHLPAAAFFAIAWLLGLPLLMGRISSAASAQQLIDVFSQPFTAILLVPLSGLLAGAAAVLLRGGRAADARFLAIAAGGASALSIGLMSLHGFARGNDHGATWLYAFYCIAATIGAHRFGSRAAAWIAVVLLGAALVQGMGYRYTSTPGSISAWVVAALAHCTLLTVASIARAVRFSPTAADAGYAEADREHPALLGALVSCAASAMLIVASVAMSSALMWHWTLLLSAVLGSLAFLRDSAALFTACQVALYAAGGFALREWMMPGSWRSLQDVRTWQAYGIVTAIITLGWNALRLVLARLRPSALTGRLKDLVQPPWPAIDRAAMLGLFCLHLVLAIVVVTPGLSAELRGQASNAIASASQGTSMEAWSLLMAVLLLLGTALWERFKPWHVLGIVLTLISASLLIAAPSPGASASLLRWLLAGFAIVFSVPIWLRSGVNALVMRLRWPGYPDTRPIWLEVRTLVLGTTFVPILILSLQAVAAAIAGRSILPSAAPMGHLGLPISHVVPLIGLCLVLAIHALRERSQMFALSTGLLVALTTAIAQILALFSSPSALNTANAAHVLHAVAIAASAYTLGWLVLDVWLRKRNLTSADGGPSLIAVLPLLAAGLLLLVLVPTEIQLILNPASRQDSAAAAASPMGWVAWVFTAVVALGATRRERSNLGVPVFAAATLVLGSLLALSVTKGDGWAAYHVLLATRLAAPWILLGIAFLASLRPTSDEVATARIRLVADRPVVTTLTAALAGLALLLSLRTLAGDPTAPDWTLLGLMALASLGVALRLWSGSAAWLYATAMLISGATMIAWLWGLLGRPLIATTGLTANIIALACSGLAAFALEVILVPRIRRNESELSTAWPLHRVAATLCLSAVLLIAALSFPSPGLLGQPQFLYAALAATSLLLLCNLWDRDAQRALVHLYLFGPALGAVVLNDLGLPFPSLWTTVVMLSGYAVFTSYLYVMRNNLALAGAAIGIPLRQNWPAQQPGWLGGATLIQTAVVFCAALILILNQADLPLRLGAAASAGAMTVALALLFHRARRPQIHALIGLLAPLALTMFGWAWLAPSHSELMLNRLVILLIALATTTIAYAVVLPKRLRETNPWSVTAKALVSRTAAFTIAVLVLTMVAEATQFRTPASSSGTIFGLAMAWWAMMAVGISLLTLAVACVYCAVAPGRDPFGLSERGRTAYIYAAEVLLALLFVHTKMCIPDLLQIGVWRRYWPIIVIGIAFVGVGLSEYFRRQNRLVLADPLEKTGAFLPILPALCFFLIGSSHRAFVHYEHVLFLGAAAYGLLALLRRSFLFGLLSAAAANGGFWFLLSQSPTLSFFQHPQLWLIPAAVSVLGAAHLNRDRLAAGQLRLIRYLTVSIIYASSTADILIHGVGRDFYLPMILAALSVLGVLAGIVLRVRSFLLLGMTFLLISLATIIQFAAERLGSWPWLVAGIVVGCAMIALFALFEKRRADLLQLAHTLRHWET